MDSPTALPHFELKYCERCGGLWLRPDGAAIPYCPACERFMAELPLRRLRNQRTSACRVLVSGVVLLFILLANFRPEFIAGGCA